MQHEICKYLRRVLEPIKDKIISAIYGTEMKNRKPQLE